MENLLIEAIFIRNHLGCDDHTVIAVWLKLVPIGVPAIFFGLGMIVSILQAFIFSLLTMIYIGLALDEPH